MVQKGDAHPHLPAQSYWPITLAFGLPIIGYGLIFNLALAFVGGAIVLASIYGWVLEPGFEHHDGGHDDGHGDGADQGGDGAPSWEFATMVWAKSVQTGRHVATAVHQCMGGYGFATEYDCQLFSRRIRSWSMRLGDPGPELAELARRLLDPAQRDAVSHLWNHDRGVPIPRWARELDELTGSPDHA